LIDELKHSPNPSLIFETGTCPALSSLTSGRFAIFRHPQPPTPAGFPNFPPHNAHFPACPAPDLLFGVVFALCAADEVSSASFKRVLCESFALKI